MDEISKATLDCANEYPKLIGKHYDYTQVITVGNTEIHVRAALPQEQREKLAMDISASTLIFDEKSGLVYEGCNRDVMRMVCMLRYYTNLDVDAMEIEERYLLYDMLEACGELDHFRRITENDMKRVETIFELLSDSAQRIFENTHTLPYQIQQAFSSVLTTENLSETLAKASTVNNKMVDMLGAFRREQMTKPSVGGSVVRFDKKDK